MLRVDRETDVLPELNEDGRLSENGSVRALFSGKTSVMSLRVDALPSWFTSFTSIVHHLSSSAERTLIFCWQHLDVEDVWLATMVTWVLYWIRWVISQLSSSSASRSSTIRKRKQRDNDDRTTEVLHLAVEKLKALQSEDSFDVYGKHIAHKLRALQGNQHVFAQKLINDVLFEADMEALTRDFKVINCGTRGEPYHWRSTGAPSGDLLQDMPQCFPLPPTAGPSGTTSFQQRGMLNPRTRVENPCPGTSDSGILSHFYYNFDVHHSSL